MSAHKHTQTATVPLTQQSVPRAELVWCAADVLRAGRCGHRVGVVFAISSRHGEVGGLLLLQKQEATVGQLQQATCAVEQLD